MPRLSYLPIVILAVFALSACQQNRPEVVLSSKNALELRAMQSRVFETTDEKKIMRSIIAVMQDLGYAITAVEPDAGVITGNKLAMLELTAAVSPKDEASTRVRANAVVRVQPSTQAHQVDEAEFYQTRFFDPLSQALFLDALLDDAPAKEAETAATVLPGTQSPVTDKKDK